MEDVFFEYITGDGEVVRGPVEYTGLAIDLILRVNPDTGEAAIANLSPFLDPPDVKGYSILSTSGLLLPDSWESFFESGNAGEGWTEANPNSLQLSELNLENSTLFAANSVIGLGQIVAPGETFDLVFEYINTAGEVLLGTVQYGELPGGTLRGDFNLDGTVDLLDIDLLGAEIASGSNTVSFDLNSDNLVDTTDLNLFLGDNVITSGNKLNGDADFSGDVQFRDFVVLANNFGTAGNWSVGDFDATGEVQFPDFVILANNFGQSAAAAAAVPEPSSALMLCVLAGAGVVLRRKEHRMQAARRNESPVNAEVVERNSFRSLRRSLLVSRPNQSSTFAKAGNGPQQHHVGSLSAISMTSRFPNASAYRSKVRMVTFGVSFSRRLKAERSKPVRSRMSARLSPCASRACFLAIHASSNSNAVTGYTTSTSTSS
jgi:hypothetical protein